MLWIDTGHPLGITMPTSMTHVTFNRCRDQLNVIEGGRLGEDNLSHSFGLPLRKIVYYVIVVLNICHAREALGGHGRGSRSAGPVLVTEGRFLMLTFY